MRLFGSGLLWGTPSTDANGNAITNASPVRFGILQDVSVDINFDTKLLYGQNQFAIDAGRGKGKIAGKAKFAEVNGALINSLFFGQTTTAGILDDHFDVTGQLAAATVTPVVPSSGTWSVDLGVRDGFGIPFTKVASAPATGQYSVAAGVYTFAAADSARTVFIDYQYTATSTTAKKSVVTNLLMGQAPTFRCDLKIPRLPKALVFTFNNCISNKFSIASKQDDFIIPEFDFDIFADPNGNIMTWGSSD